MIRLEQRLTALRARGILPQNLRTVGQDYGALIALVVLILFNLIFTRQFNSVIAITELNCLVNMRLKRMSTMSAINAP